MSSATAGQKRSREAAGCGEVFAEEVLAHCEFLERKLSEAQHHMVTLAKDNERLHVILRRYMEKDDRLLSLSQLSNADEAPLPAEEMPMSQMSQLSQLSEPGDDAQLGQVYEFIDTVKAVRRPQPSPAKRPALPPAVERIPTGVGVMIVDEKDHPGCVLVGRRKGSHGAGMLALPGGHLEKHESWATCASRELKEETNLNIPAASLRFVWVDNSDMPGEDRHYTTVFLVAPMPDPEATPPLQNTEPEKCDGWEWIAWEALRKEAAENGVGMFIPLRNCVRGGCDPFAPEAPAASSDYV